MPNATLQRIVASRRKKMYGDAEQDIRELMRLLGLSRQDVLALLGDLEELESRYGDFGRALLLQRADQETRRLDRLWAGLAVAFGAAVSSSVDRGWQLGVEAAGEIAAHMAQVAPQVTSMASALSANAIPFADKATLEIESRIRGELMRGILAHDDMRSLSKRLVGAGLGTEGTPWKSAAARAETVINTETSRAYHAALQASFERADFITGWQWVTYPEGPWPCPDCAPRHGQVYPKGLVPACPAHPSCRCGLIPVTQSYGAHDLGPVKE